MADPNLTVNSQVEALSIAQAQKLCQIGNEMVKVVQEVC